VTDVEHGNYTDVTKTCVEGVDNKCVGYSMGMLAEFVRTSLICKSSIRIFHIKSVGI